MILETTEPMVITIDPGKVTGMARYFPLRGLESYHSWEELGGLGGFADAWRISHPDYDNPDVTIVIEKYTIGAKNRAIREDYNAVYINGFVLGLSRWTEWNVIQNQVSGAKTFATDEKLKALGWYNPTPGGHSNDAGRHMLTHAAKQPWGQPILRRLAT